LQRIAFKSLAIEKSPLKKAEQCPAVCM